MKSEQGFTLIEAMIALVVISTGLLALGSFTISVLRADATARARTLATHVAEQMLEEWSATDALNTTFGVSVPAAPTAYNAVNTSNPVSYTPSADINIAYTLTASVSRMLAPIPDGSGGVDENNDDAMLAGTPTPVEKKVIVSWTRDGRTYSVYLTHATVKQ